MNNKDLNFDTNFNIALFLRKLTKDFDIPEYLMSQFDTKEWLQWLADRPKEINVDWSTFKLWFTRRELIGNKPSLSSLFYNYNFYCQSDVHDFNFNVCEVKFFLQRQKDNEKFDEAKELFQNLYKYDYSIWGVKPTKDYINNQLEKVREIHKGYIELHKLFFYIEFDKDIMRKKLDSINFIINCLENRNVFLNIAKTCKEDN